MNNSNVSHKSHHYIIGKRLNKNDAMKIKEIQQKTNFFHSLTIYFSKVGNFKTINCIFFP